MTEKQVKRAFNGVKIISATMAAQRHALGETITRWIAESRKRPGFELVDVVVRQSSDAAFHCLSYSIFYWETPQRG